MYKFNAGAIEMLSNQEINIEEQFQDQIAAIVPQSKSLSFLVIHINKKIPLD